MNTDKERGGNLTKENSAEEDEGWWNLNSVDPGRVVPIPVVFSSSVFICVHPWFQTALPCA
jgi:hypothetical protein